MYDLSTETPPETFYVEGIDALSTDRAGITVDIVYTEDGATISEADTVLISVVSLNATAFRPINSLFGQETVPEEDEETKLRIRRNGDDDDRDGGRPMTTPDSEDDVISSGEDDLIKTELKGSNGFLGMVNGRATVFGNKPGIKVTVTRSSNILRLYNSPHKDGDLFDGGNSFELTLDRPFFTEYASAGNASASLTITLRDTVHERDVFSDKLVFRPFNSIVIGFLGHSQTLSWPPQSVSPGIYELVHDLYADGYDAHLFGKTGVNPNGPLIGMGLAYREVANAINHRGVEDVAIFGFSHGGGSTYLLAQRMREQQLSTPSSLAPYNLKFTGYIDARRRGTLWDETRRPPNSLYHLNQYQENDNFLTGSPTDSSGTDPALTVNVNQSDLRFDPEVEGELGDLVKHNTLPNHQVVKDRLLEALRENMPTR